MNGSKTKSPYFFISSEETQKTNHDSPIEYSLSNVWLVYWIACVPCDWSLNQTPLLIGCTLGRNQELFITIIYIQ